MNWPLFVLAAGAGFALTGCAVGGATVLIVPMPVKGGTVIAGQVTW